MQQKGRSGRKAGETESVQKCFDLIELVTLALSPQCSDIDSERFCRILERWRFRQNARYLIAFNFVEAG